MICVVQCISPAYSQRSVPQHYVSASSVRQSSEYQHSTKEEVKIPVHVSGDYVLLGHRIVRLLHLARTRYGGHHGQPSEREKLLKSMIKVH